MRRLGVLVVCYSARETAMIEALMRSKLYDVSVYVADKQKNPRNYALATEHRVVSLTDMPAIVDFAGRYANKINVAIAGSEIPILAGLRNQLEANRATKDITVLTPTAEAAIEGSKVLQRKILGKCYRAANPSHEIYDPAEMSASAAKDAAYKWTKKLGMRCVVKPDNPAKGKGVGVYGDHFTSFDEMWELFFAPNFAIGKVLVEERLDGVEISGQFLSDGNSLIELPYTMDHKRAFDGDKGPNTGGMAALKGYGKILPFMTEADAKEAREIAKKLFIKLSFIYGPHALRGMPIYAGFMLTRDGVKVLEINSRPGDPEWQVLQPLMIEDFADVLMRMKEGRLGDVRFRSNAAVALYKVPQTYGGRGQQGDTRIDLSEAYKLAEQYGGDPARLSIYPGSMKLNDDGTTHTLSSRTVCSVGVGRGGEEEQIENARKTAQKGLNAIEGDLWQRFDPATREYIQKCVDRMKGLREKN